ncbi:MAG: cobalt-precorrin-5B (C(1))-methyltransferase CbiD [Cyanobacteria bacterium P01_A01_bin.135]
MTSAPQSGYTLPVFACAAALAALKALQQPSTAPSTVSVDLITPAQIVEIPVEQAARLDKGAALAITRSQPGDNLDITRHTPLWAQVRWGKPGQVDAVEIHGGEGLGRHEASGDPAIYRYAHQLLHHNLGAQLQAGQKIQVTLVLPEGRQLAERTSNRAFGVVDGLSLLGTSGIAQPLSAPAQLAKYRQALQQSPHRDCLVLCIGENGLALAQQMGIAAARTFKTANWIGPMLVEAAAQGVDSVILLGYHGKLLKLAGGIFHTHHQVADGRQEVLAACSAEAGLPIDVVRAVLASSTAEAALDYLQSRSHTPDSASRVYRGITERIERRSREYVYRLSQQPLTVGAILFDRQRQIVSTGKIAETLLHQVC